MNTIPADDSRRSLASAKADGPKQTHIGLVGDTYTILLTGEDTAGRYCLTRPTWVEVRPTPRWR